MWTAVLGLLETVAKGVLAWIDRRRQAADIETGKQLARGEDAQAGLKAAQAEMEAVGSAHDAEIAAEADLRTHPDRVREHDANERPD